MDRRSFTQSLAGAGLLAQANSLGGAQAPVERTRLYRLDYFYYRQGDQGTRLNQFFSSQVPLFAKHIRTFGVFTAVMAPHAQTMMALSGFASSEDMAAAAGQIESDPGYQKAHAELENGAEPPYDSAQRVLLAQ